jgi:hypothetical protein
MVRQTRELKISSVRMRVFTIGQISLKIEVKMDYRGANPSRARAGRRRKRLR